MKNKAIDKNQINFNGNFAELASKVSLRVGFLGILLSFLLFFVDKHQFYFSYLTVFSFYLTITLGSMFFVMILHLTRAGWGVVVRRISEHLMSNIGYMALLFLPLIFGIHDLYHWSHPSELAADYLLQVKAPFLNSSFFLFRALLYFLVWYFISKFFFKYSVMQDRAPSDAITLKLQKAATFSMILYALTQSFAFIDWIMSITPHWYSTIFGVYFFAGSAMVSIVVLTLILMLLRKKGYLKEVVTVEHFHDLGKLSYGFMIFWSYIAFSQFFLIWYANIPEETLFYQMHFTGSWNYVSILLCIGHFAIPFIAFMSRHIKRNLKMHCCMAIWLLFMHLVDVFWVIMPNLHPKGLHVSIVDVSLLFGIGGIYFSLFFTRLKKFFLIPINDPRLSESLKFKNH